MFIVNYKYIYFLELLYFFLGFTFLQNYIQLYRPGVRLKNIIFSMYATFKLQPSFQS